jgi:hypothetical protein
MVLPKDAFCPTERSSKKQPSLMPGGLLLRCVNPSS